MVLLKIECIYTHFYTVASFLFCYTLNLLYKLETRLHLSIRINPIVTVILLQHVFVSVCHSWSHIQFFHIHACVVQPWGAHEASSQKVSDPLVLLISLEESNTPSCLLLATHVPPDLFSACVVSLAQRTLAENSLTPGPYKSTKAPAANQKRVSVHLHI